MGNVLSLDELVQLASDRVDGPGGRQLLYNSRVLFVADSGNVAYLVERLPSESAD